MIFQRPVKSIAGVVGALALGLLTAGAARANPQIYRRLLHSAGWVVVPSQGKMSAGTCFVVDREHHLAVTCRHVVGESSECLVYFPRYLDGEALVDANDYLDGIAALTGRVIARDEGRDLALIRLDGLPDDVSAVRLAERSPEPGESVYSIGNSGLADGGFLWRYTRGDVRLVYSRKVKMAKKTKKVRILETQSPVNEGDSGGPVVNRRGELVGVAASYTAGERLVSENTDVSEVRQFLHDALAARVKSVAGDASPSTAPLSFVGRWKVAVTRADKQASTGEADFLDDHTFILKGATTVSGRYACANGILLLFQGEKALMLPLSKVDHDRFQVESAKAKFSFSRQPAGK